MEVKIAVKIAVLTCECPACARPAFLAWRRKSLDVLKEGLENDAIHPEGIVLHLLGCAVALAEQTGLPFEITYDSAPLAAAAALAARASHGDIVNLKPTGEPS